MAKIVRDLELSSLSESGLAFEHLKRLKPISQKDFELLPAETQKQLSVLFDQSVVIWSDEKQLRELSRAEIVDLLEPYKTRSFKTYPKFLKEDLLALYKRGVENPKLTQLLLWFIDKRDFDRKELPEEINQFLDSAYQRNFSQYDEVAFDTLVNGLRKINFVDLNDDQKAFLNGAFSTNIDKMTNEQFSTLVHYVKNATAMGTKFERMPQSMQDFVLGCYKRCVVRAETKASNDKMSGKWFQVDKQRADERGLRFDSATSGMETVKRFAAFNRAFVGCNTIDRAMYFYKPTIKLTLPHLINYANMQRIYLARGSFFGSSDSIFQSAREIAVELGLPSIYALYGQSYHFDSRVLLPYTKADALWIDEKDGLLIRENNNHTKTYHVETERDYALKLKPLDATFDNMIEYYARVATKNYMNDTMTPDDQDGAAKYLISIFGGELTQHCKAIIDNIATEYELKKPAFVQATKESMKSLMNANFMADNLLQKTRAHKKKEQDLQTYLLSLSDDELKDWIGQKHSKAELRIYKETFEEPQDFSGYHSGHDASYDGNDIYTWSQGDIEYRIDQIEGMLRGKKIDDRERKNLQLERQELYYLLESDKFRDK